MLQPQVIDLSHYNVIPQSLRPAKQAGVVGVIHKATQGLTYTDPKIGARHYLAKQAGMLWGVYHFLTGDDPVKQAKHFFDASHKFVDDETLIACDHEQDATLSELLAFLDAADILFDRQCVLYSGHTIKEQLGTDAAMVAAHTARLFDRRLWLADYGDSYKLPKGYKQTWLWQFTDIAAVPGIEAAVDGNIFTLSKPVTSQVWAGKTIAVPPSEPELPTIKIIKPKGVNIVIEEL